MNSAASILAPLLPQLPEARLNTLRRKFFFSLIVSLTLVILSHLMSFKYGYDFVPLSFKADQGPLVIIGLSALQLLVVGLPLAMAVLRNPSLQLSKFPAIVASFFSLAAGVYLHHFFGSFLVEYFLISSYTQLVLSFLFYLDEKNSTQADSFAHSLEELQVDSAQKIVSDGTEFVDPKSLREGDIILVQAGDIIPRDGEILSGTTSVDESDLTKEFRPLHKDVGYKVVGGTINRDNDIQVRVAGDFDQDVLSLMIAQTTQALDGKAPLKQRAQLFSRLFPILFLGLAVGLGIYWHQFAGQNLHKTFLSIIGLLLASPLCLDSIGRIALLRLIGEAVQKGLLFAKATVLERLGSIRELFFNKTGFLTIGSFAYSQEFVQSGNNLGDMLSTVFSLERQTRHPLSKAIKTHPWYNEIPRYPVKDLKVHDGLGISGIVQPKYQKEYKAFVGNLRFLKRNQCHISRELKSKIDDLESIGETVILCGYHRQVKGLITFTDTLHKNVRKTLGQIQNLGIKTTLVTSDTEKTITQMLGSVGLDKIHSRLTPEEKVQKVDQAQSKHPTAFVSNDTLEPVFDKAELTLSTDTGSDIKTHPADVMIMGSRIDLLSWLLSHTRLYKNALRLSIWGSLLMSALLITWIILNPPTPMAVLGLSALWSFFLLEKISLLRPRS